MPCNAIVIVLPGMSGALQGLITHALHSVLQFTAVQRDHACETVAGFLENLGSEVHHTEGTYPGSGACGGLGQGAPTHADTSKSGKDGWRTCCGLEPPTRP
jgi:hypothetical protein